MKHFYQYVYCDEFRTLIVLLQEGVSIRSSTSPLFEFSLMVCYTEKIGQQVGARMMDVLIMDIYKWYIFSFY
jgi:hypothetical protein